MRRLIVGVYLGLVVVAHGQAIGAGRTTPNLVDNIDRPLRYRPDGADFVIENGAEFFNRPLYGGNTAFRVDGGDKPEFVLYLPGRGGNIRLGLRSPAGVKWLHDAARIETRYRPGMLVYEIRDPLLGPDGRLRLQAIAYHQTEGLALRLEPESVAAGVELVWAYGGINGQRGARDGDIGTERVPISQWFQLQPEFCIGNVIQYEAGGRQPGRFTVGAPAATIVGLAPVGAQIGIGDANKWADLAALLASAGVQPMDRVGPAPSTPAPAVSTTFDRTDSRISVQTKPEGGPAASVEPRVVVGRIAMTQGQPVLLSLQRVAAEAVATNDLATYKEVGAPPPAALQLRPEFAPGELPARVAETEQHFAALRSRVSVETPDAFLNAAAGALNIAADAVWDEPQQAVMHGAIAWRTRLLGWRGPYALDALGWHDRFQQNFTYWAGRQNTQPVPERIPPADENANLARSEAGLHSNGDMSNSHYDMNLVAIDAFFRHLRWTGDLEFARKMWPVIERHMAWERRLFRREFGPEGRKLPLYEAYAAIWASDDLQYHGGGTMHASAYNYWHNLEAARLARRLNVDPTIYQREAQLLELGMREHLWLPDRGHFAEFKDLLGLQRAHPSAALWTFYHTMDSEVPTPMEAWQMTRQVETDIPQIPVRGAGVPMGFHTLATTNWRPYRWSINNVVMSEVMHTALGFWQAGRPEGAWKMAKGSLLAAMFMGISPGNVGSMSYLDVYRRESQRDFADGSGTLSRALVEGLFGVRPDALVGELRIEPGFPADWNHAALRHPDVELSFRRTGATDTYVVAQRFRTSQRVRLRLRAPRDRVESVTVNGVTASWHLLENSVGFPRIDVLAPAASRHEIVIAWGGTAPREPGTQGGAAAFVRTTQADMRWWEPARTSVNTPPASRSLVTGGPATGRPQTGADVAGSSDPVDLTAAFNDRVTQIFKNEYRSPRSPHVSLAIPKQGIGGWAGGVNASAEIDDSGLRAAAARNGGRLELPNGVSFALPAESGARNVVFTSQWDNYPRDASVALSGRGRSIHVLLAGTTNHMQSHIDNGEVIVTFADGTTTRLALVNPANWWPIDEDLFIDDFQFRIDETIPLPTRVDLRTGQVRVLTLPDFKGRGRRVSGGAANVLQLPLDPTKELKTLTVRALSNEVVIGLMAATVVR